MQTPIFPFSSKAFLLPAKVTIPLAALLSTSCAFHPDLTEPEITAARTFTPPKGKAMLYVYRPPTVKAMAAPRPVFINRQHLASNTNGTFMIIPLKPGKYTVQAAAQALIDEPRYRAAYPDFPLSLTAGQAVFIRQSVGSAIGTPSVMLLQTGGNPVPLLLGNDLPPFKATIVDRATAGSESAGLKHVGADPYDENPE